MKCPACWAEKAFIRQNRDRKDALLRYLLLMPMRCHHCYHEFYVFWFSTIGKRIDPPQRPPRTTRYTEGQPGTVPYIRRRHFGSSASRDGDSKAA